jgi:hypothetical protein
MRTVDAAEGRSPGPRTKRILHLVPAIANGASLLCFRELDGDPHHWDVCGGERQAPASASTLCLLTQPGLLVDIMYIVGVAGADARDTFERWLHEACREGTPWGSAEHRKPPIGEIEWNYQKTGSGLPWPAMAKKQPLNANKPKPRSHARSKPA